MTSAIEKATNSIYNRLINKSYSKYKLPIKSLDGVICDCDFFKCIDREIVDTSILFVITILDTARDNINGDYTENTFRSNCKITDESKSKIFISDMLRELPKVKFNKLRNTFEMPNEDEEPSLDVYELFKDEENIKLRIEACPCCLEPCNWSLWTCGHSICPPCFQKLPTIYDDDCNAQKTCPTCRGDCIKIVDDDD